MTRLVATAALLAGAVSFTACDGFGQAMTSHTDVLARAGGHEFTIEQASNLLTPYERVPAQPEVVDAIANLWVDYTLLALASARDSTRMARLTACPSATRSLHGGHALRCASMTSTWDASSSPST